MWFQVAFTKQEKNKFHEFLYNLRTNNYTYEKFTTSEGYDVEYKKNENKKEEL